MAFEMDYRSVAARRITGDVHAASTTHFPLPPANQVKITQELAGLRQALEGVQTPDRLALDHLLDEAGEESRKPSPDRAQLREILCSVIALVRPARNFGEQAPRILPRIAAIASWLGPHGPHLLVAASLTN